MRSLFLALGLALALPHAAAQLAPPDPDWKETEAPAPPKLRTQGLVALELPRGSNLRFGVDPASVSVGADGVVRYVVVASSTTGTVNGLYEGIRCSTGEFKLYARHNPDSGWVPTKDAEWRPLHGTSQARHSLFIARNGACVGHGTGGTAQQIVRNLGASADERLRN